MSHRQKTAARGGKGRGSLRRERLRAAGDIAAVRETIRMAEEMYARIGSYPSLAGGMTQRLVLPDAIIDDEDDLFHMTGYTREMFRCAAGRFAAWAGRSGRALLFRDGRKKMHDPGNRRKLLARHAVLMAPYCQRHKVAQAAMQGMFGLDQPDICRNIRTVGEGLDAVMPTADSLSEWISGQRDPAWFAEACPGGTAGTPVFGGTRTEMWRPGDGERARDTYSGKVKYRGLNTGVCSTLQGTIVALTPSEPGTFADVSLLRRPLPLGRRDARMRHAGTPDGERTEAPVGPGLVSVDEDLPGADVRMPHKKAGKQLTERQKAENRALGRRRAAAEGAIGALGQLRVIADAYTGTEAGFRSELDAVSGHANLFVRRGETRRGGGRISEMMDSLMRRRRRRAA